MDRIFNYPVDLSLDIKINKIILIRMSINLDQLSGDQMLAAGAALQGNANDYSNTQDVEGLNLLFFFLL